MSDTSKNSYKWITIIKSDRINESRAISIYAGDYIQTTIRDGRRSEKLWFQVLGPDFEEIHKVRTKLVNQPIIVKNMSFGDEVKIRFVCIEDHLPQDYESHKNQRRDPKG